MFSEGPLLWPHKNSFRAVLHIVSLSCSLSCPLCLSCSLLSASLSRNGQVAFYSYCQLRKKKVCVNRFQVMFKAPFFFLFLLCLHFPRYKQADSSELHPHLSDCAFTLRAHTHTLHKNMHMLSMHLQTAPLCLSGGELCHLFKCSLIVWPWGVGGQTHKL